mgnify:FL=1
MRIELGATSPKLAEQLKGLAAKRDLNFADRVSEAISFLHISRFLTDSQADSATKKLIKTIQKVVSNYHKS